MLLKRVLLVAVLLAVMGCPDGGGGPSNPPNQGTKLRPDINVYAVVGNQRLDTPIELGAAPFSSIVVSGQVPENLSYVIDVNALTAGGSKADDVMIRHVRIKYNKIVGTPEFPYMGTPVVQNFTIRYKPDGEPEVIDDDTGLPVGQAIFVLWRTARLFDRLQTVACLSWDFWVGYPFCIPDPGPFFKNGEPTLPMRVSESRLYPIVGEVPFSADEKSNPWGNSQAIEIIVSTEWVAEAEWEVEFDATKVINGSTQTERELAAGTFVMDLDKDGASNRYELNEGTDMRDPASYPGGPTQVTVPNVDHFPISDAISKLASKNLEVGDIGYRNDPIVPKDAVLEQHPAAGTVVAAGSSVNLVLSLGAGSGPNKVVVPDVEQMTEQTARNTLANAHLGTGLVNEVYSSAPAGTVIDQNPPAGALVDEFSLVNLTVSLGEEPFPAPCTVGMSAQDATTALEAVGLIVSLAYEPNNDYNQNVVFWQSPGCGYLVHVGDTVIVKVSTGPATVAAPNIVGKLTGENQEADNALEAVGLDLGPWTEDWHPTIPAGRFISQSPLAGTQVPLGTLVGGVVSKGPQPPDPLTVTFTTPLPNGDVYYNVPVWIEVCVSGGVGARSVHFQLFDGEMPNAVVPANGVYGFWHTFTINSVPNTYVTVPIRVQAYDSVSNSTPVVERWVRSFGPES